MRFTVVSDILSLELATLQLNSEKTTLIGDYEYVDYAVWKRICHKTAFIVTKDSEFLSMVAELRDHNIIQILDDKSQGVTFACIPAKKEKVKEIFQSLGRSK